MRITLWSTLGLLGLVLASCNFPGDSPPTPEPEPAYIWIDAPLDGSNIPLEPYKIVMHAMITNQHKFEISINGIVVGSAPPFMNNPGSTNWMPQGEYLWTPPAPGVYTITVKITGPSINPDHTPAQAQVTVPQPDVVQEGQPIPQIPAITATADLEVCTLTALVNLFCRPGPGYEPVDSFVPGQSAQVVAQSALLWGVIGVNSREHCTVPKDDSYVETKGDCQGLPIFTPPPTPTAAFAPVPINTPTLSLRQLPQCSDHIDNDGDGLIDLRDRECLDASDNDEATP